MKRQQDLNAVIAGPPIYEESLFQDVELRPETQALLATNPESENLAHVNRLLLEDAYPKALSKHAQAVNSG
jgi:hypothetical protein